MITVNRFFKALFFLFLVGHCESFVFASYGNNFPRRGQQHPGHQYQGQPLETVVRLAPRIRALATIDLIKDGISNKLDLSKFDKSAICSLITEITKLLTEHTEGTDKFVFGCNKITEIIFPFQEIQKTEEFQVLRTWIYDFFNPGFLVTQASEERRNGSGRY